MATLDRGTGWNDGLRGMKPYSMLILSVVAIPLLAVKQ
jgi:hypothetical protein